MEEEELNQESPVVEVVTSKKDDYDFLVKCLFHYKEKFEMIELELEEVKQQCTPTELSFDLTQLKESLGLDEIKEIENSLDNEPALNTFNEEQE